MFWLKLETPIEVFGGNPSTVNWSTIFPLLFERVNVSLLVDILKFVWRGLSSSKFNISGGVIPSLFGSEYNIDKKGIIVKSDDPGLTLWAWIANTFSPSTKIELKSEIEKRSGIPPL